jgi:hypothetical protein
VQHRLKKVFVDEICDSDLEHTGTFRKHVLGYGTEEERQDVMVEQSHAQLSKNVLTTTEKHGDIVDCVVDEVVQDGTRLCGDLLDSECLLLQCLLFKSLLMHEELMVEGLLER